MTFFRLRRPPCPAVVLVLSISLDSRRCSMSPRVCIDPFTCLPHLHILHQNRRIRRRKDNTVAQQERAALCLVSPDVNGKAGKGGRRRVIALHSRHFEESTFPIWLPCENVHELRAFGGALPAANDHVAPSIHGTLRATSRSEGPGPQW